MAPFDDLKPVKKFTSRAAAVARLWAAVQRLSPDVAPQAERVAPAKRKAKKSPTKAAGRAKAPKGAKEERSNKKAEVVALMQRAKGVTLAEIMETTGWLKHNVRGFVSLLGSKGGLKIESAKNAAGERTLPRRKVAARRQVRLQRRFRLRPGRRSCFVGPLTYCSRRLLPIL